MPAEQEEVVEALAQLREAIKTPMPREELQGIVGCELEKAGKVLKPHPDSWMRETVEMFLVVFVSVIAFRAFFLQPFKIPTGSMQPTLHGITHVNLLGDRARPVPGRAHERRTPAAQDRQPTVVAAQFRCLVARPGCLCPECLPCQSIRSANPPRW